MLLQRCPSSPWEFTLGSIAADGMRGVPFPEELEKRSGPHHIRSMRSGGIHRRTRLAKFQNRNMYTYFVCVGVTLDATPTHRAPRNKRAHSRSPFPSAPSSSLSPPTSNNRHSTSIRLKTYCQCQSVMSAEYVLVSRNEPLSEAHGHSHDPSNPLEPRHLEMLTSPFTAFGGPSTKIVPSNEKPHVCFLILGPTGSGKSSFIAAATNLAENASIVGHTLDSRKPLPCPSKTNKKAITDPRFPRPRYVNLHALPLRRCHNPIHPPRYAGL